MQLANTQYLTVALRATEAGTERHTTLDDSDSLIIRLQSPSIPSSPRASPILPSNVITLLLILDSFPPLFIVRTNA